MLGRSTSPRPHPLFPMGDFMMDHVKTKLCTKFKVATFSHCVNIEGEPANYRVLP